MSKLFEALQGYKTYIVCGAAILTALGAFLSGDLTGVQAIEAVWAAIGGMTLRHGIK